MLYLQNLDEMVLHRLKTDYYIPYNKNKPTKGYLYTMMSTEYSNVGYFFDFPDFIKMKQSDNIAAYYHEKKTSLKIGADVIKKTNDPQTIFDMVIDSESKDIGLVTYNSSYIKDKSFIYDATIGLKTYFEADNIKKVGLQTRREIFLEILKKYFKEGTRQFPKHKKILFIPIDQYVVDKKSTTNFNGKTLDNPFQLIYNLIIKSPNEMRKIFDDYLIVFSNMNEIFTLRGSNITGETAYEMKKIVTKMVANRSLPSEEVIDHEDETNNENAVKKQELIDKTEEELGVEVTQKLIEDGKINITPNSLTKKIDSDDPVYDVADAQEAASEIKKEKLPQNRLTDKEIEMREKNLEKKKNIDTLYQNSKTEKIQVIEEKQLPINNVINEAYASNSAAFFSREYIDKTLDSDIDMILKSFENKEEPLKLLHYDKIDTSDNLNKRWTYKATYEDKNGKKHQVTFDMPKYIDGTFMHLNGSDKQFITQCIPFPITKTLSDRVQVTTQYNKILLNRFGSDINRSTTALRKLLFSLPQTKIKIHIGSNTLINAQYNTTIEYDFISKEINTIEIKNTGLIIYFNQDLIREIIEEKKLKYDFNKKSHIPIAIDGKKVIVLDSVEDMVVGTSMSFLEWLEETVGKEVPQFKDKLKATRGSKRYMYNRCKIMGKYIPLIFILAYVEGIETVLEKGEVNYEFFEAKPPKDQLTRKSVIKFSDGYLVYESYPLRNSILLNGFTTAPTEDISFLNLYKYSNEFSTLFSSLFNNHIRLLEAIKNFYNLLIDPITAELLDSYDLPTDFVGVLLYANMLLEDNSRQHDSHMASSRFRNIEMAQNILYKNLSTAYESYRATADNPNPVKLSIRKESVLSDIQSSRATENYSEVSPISEIERMMSTTYKGTGGQNDDRSFSDERRAYNPTMMGIFGQSSPINASIGIARVLSTDANIKTTRGIVEVTDPKDFEKLASSKFTSPAEALVPACNTKDAAMRVSMASTQSRHTISTIGAQPQLVCTGMEKALPYLISNKFAFKAKQNGVIESIENNIMIVRYKDGSKEDINLGARIRKDASGGTHIVNQLYSEMKVGQKIKEGHIIAYNKDFFEPDMNDDLTLKFGPLLRLCVIHSPSNFEDSVEIAHSVSKRMATEVVDLKDITMPYQSVVHYFAKIGDKIKSGDPIMIFDEADNEESAELLRKLTKDESTIEELLESSRDVVKSTYDGEIVDIKIYTTVAKEDLTPSMQKMISEINKLGKVKQKQLIDAGVEDPNTDITFNEKVNDKNGKVKGVYVGKGVMIEYYIKYVDDFSVSDKLTLFSALKATVHNVISEGLEPYMLSDPNKKLDCSVGFITVEARQTKSFLAIMGETMILYDFKRGAMTRKFEELFGPL